MIGTTPDAYLMAYFSGVHGPTAEQVRFAVSQDGVDWRPLYGGGPALVSIVGTRGVRDPFLLRTDDGFVLLATDLDTWPDGDWGAAVRHGSRSIVIWESADLLEWSAPRLAAIAPPEAGNAWAPKAFRSPADDGWRVFFAAALYPARDDRSAGSYQRILMTETQDFQEFSPAVVHLDRGYDTIDLTILVTAQGVHRVSVDHIDGVGAASRESSITIERGHDLDDPFFETVVTGVGRPDLVHGEGPAIVPGGATPRLLIDEFGLRGYQLFEADDASLRTWTHRPEARLPPDARHGSIIAISAEEARRFERM